MAWFRRRGSQAWATTRVSEAGFVCVSSNAAAIPTVVTPREAVALLERMREVAGYRFLADDLLLVVGGFVDPERVASYRHVTDAHLLTVAGRHGASLVTLDRGLAVCSPTAKRVHRRWSGWASMTSTTSGRPQASC